MIKPNWVYRRKLNQIAFYNFEEQWLMRKQIREMHEEAREILKQKTLND